ncbi:unnamed protein product [Rotaria sordida]|uniref:Cyclic nucleotide-binding domain-containing protein n=1 Tax=Rotaria sordida TaxID=392033 RepID=A0A818R3W6_9BILA|nr:unnamed protein product [Rotaria sordida]
MNRSINDVTIPNGLREMLEGFVQTVILSKIKSRDLYKYAYQYFREYYLSNKTSTKINISDDIMDNPTEESIRVAYENLDEYENRCMTRAVLFGDTFNPEIEKLNLPKIKNEKSFEEYDFLRQSIPKTLPFRALDYEQIEQVIQHFELYHVKSEQILMREKEQGDYFYLIQTGIYEALINDKQVKIYNNEGSFGELALLYNQTRLATIRALTDGKLWRMNREIFSQVVRFVAFKKRQRHLEFIKKCQILQNMNEKEMLDVADALKYEEYKRGDTIIYEGDLADAMYFVKSGSVEIRIRESSNKSDYIVVKICQPGDYFGERALLYNERRAATAVAIIHCQLLVLDRADFNRLLGSAKDVLKRKAKHYKTIKKKNKKNQAGATNCSYSNRKMNETSIISEQWLNEIQFGNVGAALFIIAYIGFYGFGIMSFFIQQLKETQRQRADLPAYFLKTLWDVPSKNKLFEELADVERLKKIFRCYFVDHESYTSLTNDELQALVDERAYACAVKYREKLRRLHLSHTDYCLDTIDRLSHVENIFQEQISKSLTLIRTTNMKRSIEYLKEEESDERLLSISVV